MNSKKSKSKIIVDPRGQWAHPGKPTRIHGNDITMANVPYPVMAYPDFGSPVMMQPDKEYNFPGAKYVDEYPMTNKGAQRLIHAQEGGVTTTKSKKGTVTNTIKNPDGSKTIQVKTKNGNYYKKEVPMDYWNELDKLKEEYKYQKDYENALDYTGIVAYPAAVASSIIDASEGKYGDAALGLIPFAGKSSRAAQLLRRKVLNKAYQAGLSNKTAQALRKGSSNVLVGGTGAAQGYDATGFQKGGYKQNIKEIPTIPLMEGRTAYKRWAYGVNDKMAMKKNGGFIELDLDDAEIEYYRKGGYVVEEIN